VLSYNQLGNTAAKAVAQLLQPCIDYDDAAESTSNSSKQGLLELELSSNQITADGAAALADALAQPDCTLQVGRGVHCVRDTVRCFMHEGLLAEPITVTSSSALHTTYMTTAGRRSS
jgi:hypothetical protein